MGSVSADGVTESVEILVAGVPVFAAFADAITRFDARRLVANRKRKALGRTGSVYRQDFEGWSLSLTAADVRSALTTAVNATTATMATGLRPVIAVVSTTFYPQTGERVVHTYGDCVMSEVSRTAARGQDSEHSVTLETGEDRKTVVR